MAERPRAKKAAAKRSPRATGVQLGEDKARALILTGAAAVFAKLGARAASVEDLLKASGVSRRTFYRFYSSKEDVLVALYRLGTDDLLAACRLALTQEQEAGPLRQIQQCIEAHLRNARHHGRLVFVLGGEAQRHESSLHERRMQVHAELVALLESRHETPKAKPIDPLLYRALLLALEGVTRIVLQEGDEGRNVTDASIDRARQVMTRMATSALAGEGPGVTRLPTLP